MDLDFHRSKIVRKLQSLRVHPDVLNYSSFDKYNSLYCIFEGDFEFSHLKAGYNQPSSLLYVGSTAVGVAKRHLNRMAFYRRLKTPEFVDAELSLRYVASHDNLFDFVIVPLKSFADYQAAWAFEHELIAQWQTQLNYPKAMQFSKKTALGFQVSRKHCLSAYATFGLRLWRKLRKRLHGQCKQFTIKDCRQLTWNILYDLGSHTKAASFEAARSVRSKRMSDEEVYALIKLSRSVENPVRFRVHSILKSAVKFRGTMHWPLTGRPLAVLPLSQSSFIREGDFGSRAWFEILSICFLPFTFQRVTSGRCHIKASKSCSTTFKVGRNRRGIQTLKFKMSHAAATSSNTSCLAIVLFKVMLQQDWKDSDTFCQIPAALHWPVLHVLSFLAEATGRPGLEPFFDVWLKRHRLPYTLHGRLEKFCDEQRAAHVQALEESDSLTWSKVQEVKAKLHHQFVLYNEDHHPNHRVCYCPQFYMKSILTTWDDPAAFDAQKHTL